jgi:MerR family transcriptional regulator, light-induced transcriptional regulator
MISYSISDLEKITGIKAHTIRIWEKRYGVIAPKRTPTNIRYYDDCDLKKLLNISNLNRHGIRISQIVSMQPEEINSKVLEITGSSTEFDSHINNLIVSMIDLNEGAFEKTLSGAILKLGFEKTVTQILYPFLEKTGVLWQTGTINPAQEHFISNLIRQKLIIAIDGQDQNHSETSKTFVLYLPENELHELGLLFYSYLIRKKGHKVIYLGQSVPFNDLVKVLEVRHADCLFTSFIAAMSPEQIPVYLSKLAETFSDKKLLVTGHQLNKQNITFPKNVIHIPNTEHFKHFLASL